MAGLPTPRPIMLGRMDRPLELAEWDRRCEAALGRRIPLSCRDDAMPEQLTRDELRALGFLYASRDRPVPAWRSEGRWVL